MPMPTFLRSCQLKNTIRDGGSTALSGELRGLRELRGLTGLRGLMGLRGLTGLFYYDCLGHQDLENIPHDGRRAFLDVYRCNFILFCLELAGRVFSYNFPQVKLFSEPSSHKITQN